MIASEAKAQLQVDITDRALPKPDQAVYESCFDVRVHHIGVDATYAEFLAGLDDMYMRAHNRPYQA